MKTITKETAEALLAFLEAFDDTTTGAWAPIEEYMRDNAGIEDPETAMEKARQELQKL